jgi:hypothetical protein
VSYLKTFLSFSDSFKQAHRFLLVALLSGLLLCSSSYLARGQADADGWATPQNLSQSGTATEPIVVVGADQQLHVLWQDLLEDTFIYTHGEGNQWSQPMPVELPFGTRVGFPDLDAEEPTPLFVPRLVADSTGLIHAFWLDAEGELFYSRTQAETFADFAAWTPRQSLAEGAVGMAVTVDENGRLHLTFMTSTHTSKTPIGLYYRQSADGGNTWSESTQLYQSAYFRLLTPDLAHLQMIQDAQNIYLVWDDHPFEQIFLIRSLDGGLSWDTPEEIDQRQEGDSLEAVGPRNIQIGSQNGQVHLTWQAGFEGINCAQYHQWSDNSGLTWQTSQTLMTAFPACPEEAQFIAGPANLLLQIKTEDNTYLLVWDENDWLQPEEQPELTTFMDEAIFRPVDYTCGQTVFIEGDQLAAVSCGVGPGQDLWLTTRPLAPFVAGLQLTPIWSTPVSLAGEAEFVLSPLLVADEENRLHLFWQQADATFRGMAQKNTLFYAYWDGVSWSRKAAVLTSPRGTAEQPSVALDPQGNLLAAWGGTAGEIFFSRAATDQALIGSAWSNPISLPVPRPAAAAPSLIAEENGLVQVAYAITLNEERGIYMVTSKDGGANWSMPKRVFDAMAAGWDQVDQPRLTMTDENNWHLLWLRRSLSSGEAQLYYAHSADGGQNWSEPMPVQSNAQQTAAIVWHQIAGVGNGTVHLSWQEQNNSGISLWHQQSLDNGLNWSRPVRIVETTTISPPQMTLDVVGQVYLTTVTSGDEGKASAVLQQWVWQDGHWQANDSLDLQTRPVPRGSTLATTMTRDGHFAVAFVGREVEEALPDLLLFTKRTFDLPEVTVTPLPTLTPTPSPTATATPTATPEPTPVVEFPTQPGSAVLSLPVIGTVSGNRIIILGVLLAIIPVLLVTPLVLIRRGRSNRY